MCDAHALPSVCCCCCCCCAAATELRVYHILRKMHCDLATLLSASLRVRRLCSNFCRCSCRLCRMLVPSA